jgi:hypothetical protein
MFKMVLLNFKKGTGNFREKILDKSGKGISGGGRKPDSVATNRRP